MKLIDLKRNEERKNILQCTDVRHCRKSGTKNAFPFNFDLISSFTYAHLQEPTAKLEEYTDVPLVIYCRRLKIRFSRIRDTTVIPIASLFAFGSQL